jgi:uncharacterized protein (TIGR02996 family)
MSIEKGFLQAIVENPEDDTPRLIYADWLDEHGQPAHAEFIRAQCALAQLPEEDDRRWELAARERLLLWQHGKHWTGPLRGLVRRWRFRRGFIEEVALPAGRFLEHAAELFRLAPVRRVRLTDAVDVLPHLARLPYLARLHGLDLSHQRIDAMLFGELANSPHLTSLRELNLRGTLLCNNAGMRFLAALPALANLTSLDLSDHHTEGPFRYERWQAQNEGLMVREDGIRALAESPYLTHLAQLCLAGYQGRLSPQAVGALANSPLLGRLTLLDLSQMNMDPYGWDQAGDIIRPLFHSPQIASLRVLRLAGANLSMDPFTSAHLRSLTVLDLSSWRFHNYYDHAADHDTTLGELTAKANLPALKTLRLTDCHLGFYALNLLGQARRFPRLTCLHLDQNGFNEEGVRALAEGPLMGQLRVLTMQGPGTASWPERRHSWAGVEGARALAGAPGAAGLVHLDLGNQRITDAGVKVLADSPHLGALRCLGLWNNGIGSAGAKALLATGRFQRLDSLDLRSNPLPAGAREALRKRFGHGVRYGPGPSGDNARQRSRHNYLVADAGETTDAGGEGEDAIPF